MQPELLYLDCTAPVPHRMAYWQWGDPQASHTVVCVHGLSRQGRDFDVLASHLVEAAKGEIRVICPDVVGRGESDWLKDPMLYQIPTYAADMLALLAQLHAQAAITTLDWFGTSMGGLIGLTGFTRMCTNVYPRVSDFPRSSGTIWIPVQVITIIGSAVN